MNERIHINPALLTWARERADIEAHALVKKFPKIAEWETGESQPTLRQLEKFARAVHVPIGYLFLPEPVQETLPIADFRTLQGRAAYSLNLQDTLHLCTQRQDWFRDHARMNAFPVLSFIGSATTTADTVPVASTIRNVLQFSLADQQRIPKKDDALCHFITKVEEAGVLVMASSVVGNDNGRKLRVDEFRGFALTDDLAPLIFLNTADSKSAQLFTLAHELAHLWLGISGVSDTDTAALPTLPSERWCNALAAEFLMPIQATRDAYRADLPVDDEARRLAGVFKVSTLVSLRRMLDAGYIDRDTHWRLYRAEMAHLRMLAQQSSGGGDFYSTLNVRNSKRFSQALLASTLEGQTLFRDASRLLGIKKSETFFTTAHKLGVM